MSNTDLGNITFDLPKNQSNVIKVIGVGGGGSNAINFMYKQGIKGVDFIICNTDAQALENSPVPNKVQLGANLTEGLGAGANPEVGEKAALESTQDLKELLANQTKMLFITAGMGGGTGTGAAPIIAKMAKELNILTVGIVTMPFQFEGRLRNEQAQRGLEKLRAHVDSLVVINNNKLREVYGNLGFKAGFSKADEVLSTAARGIAEVITHHYTQNIDLHDAKTVLSNSGTAIMGSAKAKGESRAREAITAALDSPLLNDNKITGAKNVLLLIVFGTEEVTLDEIGEINDYIQTEAGHGANIIMGVGEDENLEDAISVTIIATGFKPEQQHEIVHVEAKKIIHTLEEEQKAEHTLLDKEPFTPNISVEDPVEKTKTHQAPVLADEDVQEISENTLIKTTAQIREIEVSHFDWMAEQDPQSFVIHELDTETTAQQNKPETPSESFDKKEEELYEEQQFTLTFDLPREANKNVVDTDEDAFPETDEEVLRNTEVHQAQEFIPYEEVSSEGVKKYSLEDYMDLETKLTQSKAPETEVEEEEPVAKFEKKIVEKPKETVEESTADKGDPFDSPIDQVLRERAEERRRRMKEFNYKFTHSTAHIEEFEKQPAYKRHGIELDNRQHSQQNLSKTTLSSDDDNGFTLKTKNSFLHDNVD